MVVILGLLSLYFLQHIFFEEAVLRFHDTCTDDTLDA